jgi:hypothetical protein
MTDEKRFMVTLYPWDYKVPSGWEGSSRPHWVLAPTKTGSAAANWNFDNLDGEWGHRYIRFRMIGRVLSHNDKLPRLTVFFMSGEYTAPDGAEVLGPVMFYAYDPLDALKQSGWKIGSSAFGGTTWVTGVSYIVTNKDGIYQNDKMCLLGHSSFNVLHEEEYKLLNKSMGMLLDSSTGPEQNISFKAHTAIGGDYYKHLWHVTYAIYKLADPDSSVVNQTNVIIPPVTSKPPVVNPGTSGSIDPNVKPGTSTGGTGTSGAGTGGTGTGGTGTGGTGTGGSGTGGSGTGGSGTGGSGTGGSGTGGSGTGGSGSGGSGSGGSGNGKEEENENIIYKYWWVILLIVVIIIVILVALVAKKKSTLPMRPIYRPQMQPQMQPQMPPQMQSQIPPPMQPQMQPPMQPPMQPQMQRQQYF